MEYVPFPLTVADSVSTSVVQVLSEYALNVIVPVASGVAWVRVAESLMVAPTGGRGTRRRRECRLGDGRQRRRIDRRVAEGRISAPGRQAVQHPGHRERLAGAGGGVVEGVDARRVEVGVWIGIAIGVAGVDKVGGASVGEMRCEPPYASVGVDIDDEPPRGSWEAGTVKL